MNRSTNLFWESFGVEISPLEEIINFCHLKKARSGCWRQNLRCLIPRKTGAERSHPGLRFCIFILLSIFHSVSLKKPISGFSRFCHPTAWVNHPEIKGSSELFCSWSLRTIRTSINCSTEGKGLSLPRLKEILFRSPAPQQTQTRVWTGKRPKGALPRLKKHVTPSPTPFLFPALIPQPSGINTSWNIKRFYKKEKNNPDTVDKKFWWKN